MTGLIDGSITYNPEPLERPAPGNVLVCCSQPNPGALWIFERNGRSPIMRSDIVPGGIFPDYELPDHTGKVRKLSEL
jgi:hypothetical protein